MIGMGIEEIRRLSQEEGMNDREISALFGVHRTTVARIRSANGIPKCNVLMKKDKVSYCNRCHERFIIRRGQKRHLCFNCAPLVNGVDTIVEEVAAWKKNKNSKNNN